MKKYTPAQLLRMLAGPGLTVLLGLVLLFSPDTASALVGKLIAWCCILAALALGAGVFLGDSARRNNRVVWAAICFFAGVYMLMHPLTIAKFLGRVLGLALALQSARSVAENIRYEGGKLVFSRSLVISAVMLVAGMALVVLPLASSRMFFNIIGIVLVCVGIAQGLDNLRGRKLLNEGSDPNIIDVEKV